MPYVLANLRQTEMLHVPVIIYFETVSTRLLVWTNLISRCDTSSRRVPRQLGLWSPDAARWPPAHAAADGSAVGGQLAYPRFREVLPIGPAREDPVRCLRRVRLSNSTSLCEYVINKDHPNKDARFDILTKIFQDSRWSRYTHKEKWNVCWHLIYEAKSMEKSK